MAISLSCQSTGPSVLALRAALAAVPERGTFNYGYAPVPSTDALSRFRAAGLSTPDFTVRRAEAESWVRQGHTVLGRRQRHTQGSDIVTAGPREAPSRQWNSRDWWSKYTQAHQEWRIHIFDGRPIGRGLKHRAGQAPAPAVVRRRRGSAPTVEIRSRTQGYLMRHDVREPEIVAEVARQAVASLGRTYGAVDLLVLRDRPTRVEDVLVLEVNALPAMDDYTRGRYVQAIRAHVAPVPEGRNRFLGNRVAPTGRPQQAPTVTRRRPAQAAVAAPRRRANVGVANVGTLSAPAPTGARRRRP